MKLSTRTNTAAALTAALAAAAPALLAQTVVDVRDVNPGDVFNDDTVVILHGDFADDTRQTDGIYRFDAGEDHDIHLTSDTPGYDLAMDDYSFGIRGNNVTISGLGRVTINEGPLYAKGNLVIEGNGDFTYTGWGTTTCVTTVEGGLSLIADKGDISMTTANMILNDIHRLAAAEGRTVAIKGTVMNLKGTDYQDSTLVINSEAGQTGTVLLDGSWMNADGTGRPGKDVLVNQGTLHLNHGASIEASTFNAQREAVVKLTDSSHIYINHEAATGRSVLESDLVVGGNSSIRTSPSIGKPQDRDWHHLVFDGNTVRGLAGDFAGDTVGLFTSPTMTINAGTTFLSEAFVGEPIDIAPFELGNIMAFNGLYLDISNGFNIDLNTTLGLECDYDYYAVQHFEIALGGTINLVDDAIDYSNQDWLETREFALVMISPELGHEDSTMTVNGSFDGLTHNQATAYGTWSLQEQDFLEFKIYTAVWTPLAQIPEPACALMVLAALTGFALRRRVLA